MKNCFFILKVISAEYVSGMTLRLTFNEGSTKLCDFTPMAQKGICKKLLDPSYFKNLTLDPFSVDWNNEIGFAPEFLFEHSTAA